MASSDEHLRTLLSESPDPTSLTLALQHLAAQSRESLETRGQLAGNISPLLQIIEQHGNASEDLINATLRCIGNACVESPETCEKIVSSDFDFDRFTKVLTERGPELQSLVVKVLYNICLQSEDARKKCCEAFVHGSIVSALHQQAKFIETDSDEPFGGLSFPIDLLFWITAHHHKDFVLPQAAPSYEGALERMLRQLLDLPAFLAEHLDIDDFATLLEVVLVFLREPKFQAQVAEERLAGTVWNILELNESKLQDVGDDAEDQKLLIALSTSLTWILSDVAASASFIEKEGDSSLLADNFLPLLSPDAEGRSATADSSTIRLMNAACQVVGNFVHNKGPDTAASLVQTRRVHERVLATMVATDNADFLHSAAGLLIQLSRPSPEIREEIANDGKAIVAVERLGKHTMSELNQDALKLMRALGKDTPTVQDRFKQLAGEIMATVAETQKATADAQSAQPQLSGMS
ncbi:hypothetical protein Q7P37_003522 [Cladosporium fusiforme]